MREIIYLVLLVILQNASFTLVSRARNSKSLWYHMAAAFASNGVWLFVFEHMTVNIHDATTKIAYLFASVAGSLLMHYVAMRFFEKPKKPVKQVPTVGRIVNYNSYKRSLPAIITLVHNETCVDLEIFGSHDKQKTSVTQGKEAFHWDWPEIKK